jgi:hypothetical protein
MMLMAGMVATPFLCALGWGFWEAWSDDVWAWWVWRREERRRGRHER